MVTGFHVERTISHHLEISAMLILSAVVVAAVTLLAVLLDLSADQLIKISTAYVIMGNMLVGRFMSMGG